MSASIEPTPPGTRTVRRRGQYKHARRPGRVKLRVLDGPPAGTEVLLERTRLRVGRSSSADVSINHDSLSGLHFELRLGRTGVELLDLNSKNGTFLLGRRVYHAELHPGDEILAGDCRIVLVETGDIDVDHGTELRDDGLLGVSEPILEAFARLEKLAATDMLVLLTGETGTGKDLFARAIHRHSSRSNAPFVVIDCAGMAEGLADSALFGHRRGAFTGAEQDKKGVFEQASGGTLLISEVGELPPSVQAKLPRVLDSMEIVRVGDTRPRSVDVRVIVTTHRDLPRMVTDGGFREDLYFRLNSAAIEVPTLRERGGDDIEYLARSFLADANRRAGTSLSFGRDAIAKLRAYRWKGNVRELRGVVERLPLFCDAPEIRAGSLAVGEYSPRSTVLDELARTGTLEAIHLELDRWLLPQVLKEVNGNVSEAARRLGVGRKKLNNRLEGLSRGG
ncbi:MAG: sigma 54-interacting transcriptional regulator [Deltaproteobacteria bacterium]|nr:sigma 54-interacting transcriptional regulator [Deltaproteobacteria bacterium]